MFFCLVYLIIAVNVLRAAKRQIHQRKASRTIFLFPLRSKAAFSLSRTSQQTLPCSHLPTFDLIMLACTETCGNITVFTAAVFSEPGRAEEFVTEEPVTLALAIKPASLSTHCFSFSSLEAKYYYSNRGEKLASRRGAEQ